MPSPEKKVWSASQDEIYHEMRILFSSPPQLECNRHQQEYDILEGGPYPSSHHHGSEKMGVSSIGSLPFKYSLPYYLGERVETFVYPPKKGATRILGW